MDDIQIKKIFDDQLDSALNKFVRLRTELTKTFLCNLIKENGQIAPVNSDYVSELFNQFNDYQKAYTRTKSMQKEFKTKILRCQEKLKIATSKQEGLQQKIIRLELEEARKSDINIVESVLETATSTRKRIKLRTQKALLSRDTFNSNCSNNQYSELNNFALENEIELPPVYDYQSISDVNLKLILKSDEIIMETQKKSSFKFNYVATGIIAIALAIGGLSKFNNISERSLYSINSKTKTTTELINEKITKTITKPINEEITKTITKTINESINTPIKFIDSHIPYKIGIPKLIKSKYYISFIIPITSVEGDRQLSGVLNHKALEDDEPDIEIEHSIYSRDVSKLLRIKTDLTVTENAFKFYVHRKDTILGSDENSVNKFIEDLATSSTKIKKPIRINNMKLDTFTYLTNSQAYVLSSFPINESISDLIYSNRQSGYKRFFNPKLIVYYDSNFQKKPVGIETIEGNYFIVFDKNNRGKIVYDSKKIEMVKQIRTVITLDFVK